MALAQALRGLLGFSPSSASNRVPERTGARSYFRLSTAHTRMVLSGREMMMRPVLAALCCLLLASAPIQAQEAAISVAAAPAAVGPLPVEVTANGTAQAVSVISVRSRVDGQIERVHVQEGGMVKAGDLLFTLDSRNTQALLQQQEAILARDRAQLERAQSDARRYASLRSDAYASAQRAEAARRTRSKSQCLASAARLARAPAASTAEMPQRTTTGAAPASS